MVDRLLSVVVAAVSRQSFSTLGRLGALLGWIWFFLVPVRRSILLSNLSVTNMSSGAAARRLARRSLSHLCTTALETAWLGHATKQEVQRLLPISRWERYEAARAAGRGVIVVTAHLGNFDLLACSQAAAGVPLAVVSRDLGRGALSRLWMRTRSGFGLTIFEHGKDSRRILAWLRRGNVLGLTVDQRQGPKRQGVLAPLLGVPAWTSTAAARLALRTGAALVPVSTHRRPDGTHVAEVHPQVEPLPGETAAQLTARLNDVISGWVEAHPEQWLWIHRRFSRTLPGL